MSEIPYNDANVAKIREVAEALRGTCGSLDDMLQQVFEDENLGVTNFATELLRELDDITMECQGCNWWCETHELDDGQLCPDCQDGDDDE